MSPEDLLIRFDDRPFRPFRIHLMDGTQLGVPEPGMVIVAETNVFLPSQFGRGAAGHRLARRWRTIALAHIVQFSDLDERKNGKPRRRKAK